MESSPIRSRAGSMRVTVAEASTRTVNCEQKYALSQMRVHRQCELCCNSRHSVSTRGVPRVLTLNVSRDLSTCLVTLIQLISRQLIRTDTSAAASVVHCYKYNTSQRVKHSKTACCVGTPARLRAPTPKPSDFHAVRLGPHPDWTST